jgi:glucosamine--fructose-6-phosphate aminotransferase (isomerizing)
MCGIVGYVGPKRALPILIDGLRCLEYRGYDSAGVVVLNGEGVGWEKSPGKIQNLVDRLRTKSLPGTIGIGHTRWATHGHPNEPNAHPHFSCDRRISLVHNGIIENFTELKKELRGHKFSSDTDTEVMVHLIEKYYKAEKGQHPLRAVSRAMEKIQGSFGVVVLFSDFPDLLIAARRNSPLVLGVGKGENFVASDIAALLKHTKKVIPLEEGEIAKIDPSGIKVMGPDHKKIRKTPIRINWGVEATAKGGYPHFMLKEINEQHQTLAAELGGRVDAPRGEVRYEKLGLTLAQIKKFDRVVVAACGTAWHSGLVAKCAIEENAGIPVEVAMASELRYGHSPLDRRTLMLAISQSGETADTLAAVRVAKEAGSKVLALTNIRGSSLSREADGTIFMRAGLEVGVAATKTYTSQLINVLLFSLYLGRKRGKLSRETARGLLKEAMHLPVHAEKLIGADRKIRKCARKFKRGSDFMFIGRGYNLATAFEGALKMKEISYLHAEGYGAGEMKHGPLALVDRRMTVVGIAPEGRVTEKMISNMQEIKARRGNLIAVVTKGRKLPLADVLIEIPPCPEMFSPILGVIPLQLLAYHTAVGLNKDVDQPRNLAKSVTVE